MKYILSIFIVFFTLITNAQRIKLDGQTYLMPTEMGDIECVILTKKDFNQLVAKLNALSNGNGKVDINSISEKDYLVMNAVDPEYIAKRYNKSNNNKNGFSTKEIARMFQVSDSGTESYISKRIYAAIEKIRK